MSPSQRVRYWSMVASHQRFPDRAAGHRAVADVAYDDAVLAVDLLEQRRANGDVGRTADDGVVRVDAEGQEEGVHRAAEALVEAGFLGEDLGQRAVDQEVDRQVLDASCPCRLELGDRAIGVAAEEFFHHCDEFGFGQLARSPRGPWRGFRRGCGANRR